METTEILSDSSKRLNKLKILINFFNHSAIISIAVKTKVIHEMFLSNQALDINKLELFHLQYTDSLLELLFKLKKKLEQKYILLNNEIETNLEIISSFEKNLEKSNFRDKVINHNFLMQSFMEALYNNLAYDKDSEKIITFTDMNNLHLEKGIEYYRKLEKIDFDQLQKQSLEAEYELKNYKIERKLLGKLNIQHFKFKFLCGFQYNSQFLEVYEFIHSNEYFIYNIKNNQFYSIELKKYEKINFSKNISNNNQVIQELKNKNIELKKNADQTIKSIPMDIENVLKDYYTKISSIEFLDSLQNIDEQTNILRTMLNININ
ncbi:MAG: hypothetical protein ACOVQ2_02490 [Flavobacterium sp.]